MTQAHTEIERGANPSKYEVGRVLLFSAYSPYEVFEGDDALPFRAGDRLVVEPVNGCGMGIDVRREGDGVVDMVWPEEVCL